MMSAQNEMKRKSITAVLYEDVESKILPKRKEPVANPTTVKNPTIPINRTMNVASTIRHP